MLTSSSSAAVAEAVAAAAAAAVGSCHTSVSVAFVSVSVTSLLGLELSTATDGDGFVWVGEIRRTAAVTAGGGSGPLLALELSAVMDGDGLTVAVVSGGRSDSAMCRLVSLSLVGRPCVPACLCVAVTLCPSVSDSMCLLMRAPQTAAAVSAVEAAAAAAVAVGGTLA